MTPVVAESTRTIDARRRMEKLAWLLDGALRVPGTRVRFGLDSVIGLVPGVGDVAGLLLGAAILYQSVRVGAPRALIGRMLFNSVADAVAGAVPGLGDLFDFAFKSNARNVGLLLQHLHSIEAHRQPLPSRGCEALALGTVFLVLTLSALAAAWHWLLTR